MKWLIMLLTWLALPAGVAVAAPNPIQLENAKPGTTGWQIEGGPSTHIEGYASEIGAAPGDVLHMHVSADGDARYRIEIFRLGWYHGDGGRRIACIPSACVGDEAGVQQPVSAPDPTTGELDAGWPVTDAITIGSDWTSGYYVAKLILTSGPDSGQASYLYFIVRAPAGATSKILVQASVNTWEAYNAWGGKSLYAYNSSNNVAATMVSFNRPFGDQPVLTWEYQLVRFLERHGYDVSYQTDVDTDQNPSSLLGHTLDIVSGHDEYWSKTMRDAWDAARDDGVNLAFVGADIGYWQLRYADSDRTLIEYRSATADPNPDPAEKTVAFRDLSSPRPECELLGVGYFGGQLPAGVGPHDYTVEPVAASNSWFATTGLTAGEALHGVVGYEWDRIQPGCAVPPLADLMHWQSGLQRADAVEYTAPSGARVFSDGTLSLTFALDDYGYGGAADPRVQQLFVNILDDLGGGGPGPGPEVSTPELKAPAFGAYVGSPVIFKWTAPEAAFERYVLTLDGKQAASTAASSCAGGTCTTTVAVPDGAHTWQIEAYDALGNSAGSSTGTFNVGPPPSVVALQAPSRRALLWNPRPVFAWKPATAGGAPILYVLEIDGKAALTTTATRAVLSTDLADGPHRWFVEAIADGSMRASPTRRFRIDSVRLVRRSRSTNPPRGLTVRIYCAQRCGVTELIRLNRHGRLLAFRRQVDQAGIHEVTLLSNRLRFLLQHSPRARLFVTVKAKSGIVERTVRLLANW